MEAFLVAVVKVINKLQKRECNTWYLVSSGIDNFCLTNEGKDETLLISGNIYYVLSSLHAKYGLRIEEAVHDFIHEYNLVDKFHEGHVLNFIDQIIEEAIKFRYIKEINKPQIDSLDYKFEETKSPEKILISNSEYHECVSCKGIFIRLFAGRCDECVRNYLKNSCVECGKISPFLDSDGCCDTCNLTDKIGYKCSDCGDVMSRDDSLICELCERKFLETKCGKCDSLLNNDLICKQCDNEKKELSNMCDKCNSRLNDDLTCEKCEKKELSDMCDKIEKRMKTDKSRSYRVLDKIFTFNRSNIIDLKTSEVGGNGWKIVNRKKDESQPYTRSKRNEIKREKGKEKGKEEVEVEEEEITSSSANSKGCSKILIRGPRRGQRCASSLVENDGICHKCKEENLPKISTFGELARRSRPSTCLPQGRRCRACGSRDMSDKNPVMCKAHEQYILE